MKQRILAILLTFCLIITLLPLSNATPVYADGNGTFPQLGTAALEIGSNSIDAAAIYFGNYNNSPIPWRVIDYNSSGSRMRLLTKDNLKKTKFTIADICFQVGNYYNDSALHTLVKDITGGLTSIEKATLIPRKLTAQDYSETPPYSDGLAGSVVEGALLWPLSTAEATRVDKELRKASGNWWLRSPGLFNFDIGGVTGDGNVEYTGFHVNWELNVRPACEINLSSILFFSAADGGKDSDGVGANALKPVVSNNTNQWKLTLKDTGRNFTARMTGYDTKTNVVTLSYNGATLGANEYVSAIMKGLDGSIKFYGRIAQPDKASGSCTINLDGKMANGDQLYVFSEQCNGDKKSDSSSNLQQINLNSIMQSYALTTTPAVLDFGSADPGYTARIAQTVTITNQDNKDVMVNLPASSHYNITGSGFTNGQANLTTGAALTLSIAPRTDLPAGNYDEMLLISGSDGASTGLALNFIVTAPPSSGGGGSSVSVTSPNPATANVPAATAQEPNPPVTGTIRPPLRLSDDKTVQMDITTSDIESAIDKAKKLAVQQKLTGNGIALQIDLSGIRSHFDQLPLTLPKEAYERMLSAEVKHFTVITPQLTLSLDVDSLKTIVQSAAVSSITIDVKVVDTKKLFEQNKISEESRTAFGDRPLYDVTIRSGKELIHQLGSGKATIRLPYVPAATENKDELRLATVDENGNLMILPDSEYDSARGILKGQTNHFSLYGITTAKKQTASANTKTAPEFQDTQHHWAKAAIDYVAAQGILNGTSKDRFSPDQTVTRGMFVTALYHLAQLPLDHQALSSKDNRVGVTTNSSITAIQSARVLPANPGSFADVASGSYYEAAIDWAVQNQIATGIGQKQFAPEQAISREQLVTMLYQYSKFNDFETSQAGMAIREFKDYESISSWAKPAMTWAVNSGLIHGMNSANLNPKGEASRAQLASILKVYHEQMSGTNHR